MFQMLKITKFFQFLNQIKTKFLRNKFVLLFIWLLAFLVRPYFTNPRETSTINSHYCYYSEDFEDTLPSADGEDFNPPEKSIFFHETSCRGNIDSRQACSIESAARSNPKWQIKVLFAGPIPSDNIKTGILFKLQQFKNIKLYRVHIDQYGKETPLQTLLAENFLERSRYPTEHVADVLRFVTLYKWGGVYLDLDMIVVKSFDGLPRNFAVRQNYDEIGLGVLALARDEVGRKIAYKSIHLIKKEFDPRAWSNNSVGIINKIVEELCAMPITQNMSDISCEGFNILNRPKFYPVTYYDLKKYLEPLQPTKGRKDIYAHHLWNRLTHKLRIPKTSYYFNLAKCFCPTVYRMFGNKFGND